MIGALGLTSTPLFNYFFQGKLREEAYSSSYQESIKGRPYYVTKYDYHHFTGNSIQNTTIEFRVDNSGSEIDIYEPIFKTLINKNITQIRGRNFVKIEIPLIRLHDEFAIVLYSSNRAQISSKVVMENGRLGDRDEYFYNSTTFWIISLLICYIFLFHLYYKKILNGQEMEIERIIGERNALQQVILKGDRLSVNRHRRS
jgi:hypothetical protein